tara:strand:- start:247 stop:501 length:255 start_codon:yes stop_codon:yes gene_type:complete
MKEETTNQEENSNPLYGKPWKNEFTATTFEEADVKRNNILKSDKVQVKVRRRSDGTFVVKTRDTSLPKSNSKKKKSAKNKNKEQ